MKWVKLLVALAFVAFAAVQLNDPDPWRWVALYGAIAVLWAMAAFEYYFLPAIYFLLAVSLAWMLSLLPDFFAWLQGGAESIVESMKAEKPHIELTREFLGLTIVIIALIFLWRNARRREKA